jgi:hypothetical protein
MSLAVLDLRLVHGAKQREQHRQRARVVADARRGQPCSAALHRDVRALGKHGVEVRDDRDERTAGGIHASANTHDVADFVALDVGELVRAQHLQIGRAAFVFHERRRRNLGQLDDFRDQSIVIAIDRRHGRAKSCVREHALHARVGRVLGGYGKRKTDGGDERKDDLTFHSTIPR